MLRVLHPLDESRSALVMISEPLTASLANAFGDTRRPREYEKEIDAKKEVIDFDRLAAQHELGALDVKNGLRQVSVSRVLYLRVFERRTQTPRCAGL